MSIVRPCRHLTGGSRNFGEKTKQDNGEECGARMRGALLGTRIGHCFEALGEEGERIGSGWERGLGNLRVEKEKDGQNTITT